MKTSWIIAGAVLLVLIIGGIYYFSQQASEQIEPETSEGHRVEIKDFSFKPAEIKIKQGVTITWINKDPAPHTIKFDSGEESPRMNNGQEYEKLFSEKGTYNYICGLHPSMKGAVIVE